MLNPVNHFFVGEAYDINTLPTPDKVGEIAVFSPCEYLPVDASYGAIDRGFRIGQTVPGNKVDPNTIALYRFSPIITPDSVRMGFAMCDPNSELITRDITVEDIATAYSGPRTRIISVDVVDQAKVPVIPIGTIIYLEFAFKNIRDLSPSFKNYVYSHVCQLGETLESVLESLCDQVSEDPMINEKISCTYEVVRNPSGDVTSGDIVFESKFPIYHMNQRHEWQSIDFEVSLSYSKPNVISDPNRANWHCDANILNTPVKRIQWGENPFVVRAGSEGAGYYPVVSDKEKRALAYQGITNWTKFPVELPQLFTKEGGEYICVQIPFATRYRSADNVEGKLTNEQLTIYLNCSTSELKNLAIDLITFIVSCCNYP